MSLRPDGKQLHWAGLVTLGLLVSGSSATAFTFTRTADVTAQSFADSASHLLNLGSVGTALTVVTPGAGRLAVFFNAECAVAGLDNQTWLDIDILVDGIAIPPSNSDNAFCTDSGDGLLKNWVSASTNGVVDVGPGSHDVEVRATLSPSTFDLGDSFRIDDVSLVVVPEPLAWPSNLAALTALSVLGRMAGRRRQPADALARLREGCLL